MSIDHEDPKLQRAFDVELAGQRAGIPTAQLDDFDYAYGIERAKLRAPDDEQQLAERVADLTPADTELLGETAVTRAKLRAAITRDLLTLVQPDAEPVEDDPAMEPSAREATRLQRGALAYVRAIRDHRSR